MLKIALTASVLAAASLSAQADTLALWNFNSATADNNTATGTTLPAIGAGTASLVGGVTSPSFNTGVGSSDPAASDNSGWQTTGYAPQGSGHLSRGAQFLVSTVGFDHISVRYDLRHSNTSAAHEQVQYTLDGRSWINAALFVGAAGDTWFNGRTVDLGSVAGAGDNALFGVRVVAAFAPNTSAYQASNTSYAGSGTWRFDMVSISGTPVAAVPEPETCALMLAGLVAVGFLARRRRA